MSLCLQLIFRKVADVKREKELAEKRKNDPPLDLAADHPVRKLISRFRKISDNRMHVNVTDLEKGDTKIDIDKDKPPANGQAHIINIDESSKPGGGGGGGGGMSKWGKFLAGAAAQGGGGGGGAAQPAQPAQPPHPRPMKSLSKFSKLLAQKQDTIEEKPEEEEKGTRRRADDTVSQKSVGAVTQRDVVFSVSSSQGAAGPISAAEQQVINSLYDIKMEIKEEIDVLNQKMNKIDLQINEILKMFSPASSPYTSHTPSVSSRGGPVGSVGSSGAPSGSSTASNSIVASPKSSVPSSPHHKPGLGDIPTTSIDSSRAATPPSRKNSAGSGSSSGGGGGGSRKSSPVEQQQGGAQSSQSQSSSTDSSRKKSFTNKKGSRSKVAPFNDEPTTPKTGSGSTSYTPSKEDENVHVKDRDLDIL